MLTMNRLLSVASKCGIVASKGGTDDMSAPQMTVTNKPSHIREYIEGTIERLDLSLTCTTSTALIRVR